MDYEYYYYESRNRYYDACSEVTHYENRANELRSEKQQKISYINQIKNGSEKTQKCFFGSKQSDKERLGIAG